MDSRAKQIVILCHCILNQNTVVEPLARAKGAYNQIVREILDQDIGIHQLPCPECNFLGLDRKPMNYNEYDSLPGYRLECEKLANELISTIREYIDNGYNIIGIIGINESPTCSITGKRGLFMEEIFKLLELHDINLNYMEISTNYIEGKNNNLFKLKEFLLS